MGFSHSDRRVRELEGSIAHQEGRAAALARNGYPGAAAEVLALVEKLQMRLAARRRDSATQKQLVAG